MSGLPAGLKPIADFDSLPESEKKWRREVAAMIGIKPEEVGIVDTAAPGLHGEVKQFFEDHADGSLDQRVADAKVEREKRKSGDATQKHDEL
jgi:hypothetical protein